MPVAEATGRIKVKVSCTFLEAVQFSWGATIKVPCHRTFDSSTKLKKPSSYMQIDSRGFGQRILMPLSILQTILTNEAIVRFAARARTHTNAFFFCIGVPLVTSTQSYPILLYASGYPLDFPMPSFLVCAG